MSIEEVMPRKRRIKCLLGEIFLRQKTENRISGRFKLEHSTLLAWYMAISALACVGQKKGEREGRLQTPSAWFTLPINAKIVTFSKSRAVGICFLKQLFFLALFLWPATLKLCLQILRSMSKWKITIYISYLKNKL